MAQKQTKTAEDALREQLAAAAAKEGVTPAELARRLTKVDPVKTISIRPSLESRNTIEAIATERGPGVSVGEIVKEWIEERAKKEASKR